MGFRSVLVEPRWRSFTTICLILLGLAIGPRMSPAANPDGIDLAAATLLAIGELTPREELAVRMFVEEVEKRTGRKLPVHKVSAGEATLVGTPAGANLAGPILAVIPARVLDHLPAAVRDLLKELPKLEAEGFALRTLGNSTRLVIGADERGLLFGLGYLLRKLECGPNAIHLPSEPDLVTAPAVALRGHQLGYRPKTNSYDAWDLPQWEQYIRDLVLFGTNAIELIPPKSDDAALSPHFPKPPMEMMIGMSRLADEYGLDVWIWYPAIDGDYADPEVVERALREWGDVLGKLPRVDAIFVPTGDPGKTQPGILFPFLEKQADQLRRIHPNAQVWISVQGLTQPWWEEILALLATEPDWLTGVGYGPQTRVTIPELRQLLPNRYPIRRYPDITHCFWCQYPVPDWDVAYALTLHREPINPRPLDQAILFRAFEPITNGFITYSEGCNDDVNKMVWSGLGWNPNADVRGLLDDYARAFFPGVDAADLAESILRLERNWRGPLRTNDSVPTTLAQFRAIERQANEQLLGNWRFQQLLYRAYYDAYIRSRLLYETALEEQAMEALRSAPQIGAAPALQRANAILEQATKEPIAADWRQRVHELAEALFHSIGMQLSVTKYGAIETWRGANLDLIDTPLNNREWLGRRFQRIRGLDDEAERLAAIQEIVSWTDPGPGGHYDDLGNPSNSPHWVRPLDRYSTDPGNLTTPYAGFEVFPGHRMSWCTYVDGLFATPIQLHYSGLDPTASYRVRMVYAGNNFRWNVRCVANEGIEIHPWRIKPKPIEPLEFPIPRSVTADGRLTLTWTADPTRGGNGRGCELAEVWLIKEPKPVPATQPPVDGAKQPDKLRNPGAGNLVK